jgi:hypothetical protein
MDTIIALLVAVGFLVLPLFEALLVRLRHRAIERAEREAQQRRAIPAVRAAPPRMPSPRVENAPRAPPPESMSHHETLEVIPPRPSSLEVIADRPSSPEAIEDRPISLEDLSPRPAAEPHRAAFSPVRARRRGALLQHPRDVRRGILMATLLGSPPGLDPTSDGRPSGKIPLSSKRRVA